MGIDYKIIEEIELLRESAAGILAEIHRYAKAKESDGTAERNILRAMEQEVSEIYRGLLDIQTMDEALILRGKLQMANQIMKKGRDKVYSINEIRDIVVPVAKSYGVKRVYLFGSYARGEATPGSDVDLRVEAGKIEDLFELSGFMADLETALDKSVDIVSSDTNLSEAFRKNLNEEGILLYGG